MTAYSNPNEYNQIKLSSVRQIVSRTDLKGRIEYCNDYFTEISGFEEKELIGSPHNIIRHPDMPKVIFKWMWQRLKNEKNILALVKNRSKDGSYYWVTTLFEIKYHPLDKTPEGYLALRRAAPDSAVEKIKPLYATLLRIEKEEGLEASEAYLLNFLREKNVDYDTYIRDTVEYKGLMAQFFKAMAKMFS